MQYSVRLAFALAIAFEYQIALAQHLPSPSRTVFKCELEGKTFYSDSPCLGAKRLDVEPTRGLNKSSGSERTGADVAREMRRESFAEAVKPITGMNSKQFEVAVKRQKLTPDAQRRCHALDVAIPHQERQEAFASNSVRHALQSELLNLRTEFRRLGC